MSESKDDGLDIFDHTRAIGEFLQELPSPEDQRAEMQAHWNAVMVRLGELLDAERKSEKRIESLEATRCRLTFELQTRTAELAELTDLQSMLGERNDLYQLRTRLEQTARTLQAAERHARRAQDHLWSLTVAKRRPIPQDGPSPEERDK